MKRLRRWLGRGDREFQAEILSHIETAVHENIDRGMTAIEARRAANLEFGSAAVACELVSEGRPMYWLRTIFQDIRFGFRQIARNKLVSGSVVLTMVLGIGLNSGAFSLVYSELFLVEADDPATYAEVYLERSADRGPALPARASLDDFLAYRGATGSLREIAAWNTVMVSLGDDGDAKLRAGLVSPNYFLVFGPARPRLGRLFLEAEASVPGSAPVVVLEESLWKERFDADPRIVGTVIHLNRHAFTVIGVVPPPAGEPGSAMLRSSGFLTQWPRSSSGRPTRSNSVISGG
jgi:hypothetical protein